MRIICETQRSAEWFAAHVGRVTASGIANVLSKYKDTKRKEDTADRRTYKWQKVAEILSGRYDERNYVSSYMQDGIDFEDFARASYEMQGEDVEQTGFILHPTNDRCGASPDGLVGTNGILEIKCQQPYIHLQCRYNNTIPEEYQAQMQFGMLCTGRQWCDFVSYSHSLPRPFGTFIKRLPKDEDVIAAIEGAAGQFFQEVDAIVAELRSVEGCLVPNSLPSPEELASQDMRDLEQTWR